jgi:hypothetical protein
VVNLQHLAQLVIGARTDHLRFDCDYCETIIVDRHAALQGTREVLQAHSIPAAMSLDLQQALQVDWPPPLEGGQQQGPAAARGGSNGSSSKQAQAGASQAAAAAAAPAVAVVAAGAGHSRRRSRRSTASNGSRSGSESDS